MSFNQSPYQVRFEWGQNGLRAIGPGSDVVVLVDVLSFSTCVEVATSRGAVILPYRGQDGSAAQYALEQAALLANKRRSSNEGYCLSPASLRNIPAGTRLVLPSPNGSMLSLQAAEYGTTLTACLRNYQGAARLAGQLGTSVAVLAAGEQWADGTLRPCLEDLIGAGAVITHLPGQRSPEAEAAAAFFSQIQGSVSWLLRECASGRELIERGFEIDLAIAAECNVSTTVPLLTHGAFVARQC